MLNNNLKALRKRSKLSQEQMAEKINVSRQTVAKWESGESVPDINTCLDLAEIFNVTLDDLVNYVEEKNSMGIPPKGKHCFGIIEVNKDGGIIIPEKAREVFNIKEGDKLLVLGDEFEGGLALMCENRFEKMLKQTDV